MLFAFVMAARPDNMPYISRNKVSKEPLHHMNHTLTFNSAEIREGRE